MVAARFDAQARDRARERGIGDPQVVVKEPGSHAAELIMSLFPGAGLIFLLRDGRDVVDSWLDAYKAGSWALEEGAYSVGGDDRMAFIRWQSSVWAYRTEAVRRVYDARPADRRVLLRYEEVREDPAAAWGESASGSGSRRATPGSRRSRSATPSCAPRGRRRDRARRCDSPSPGAGSST